MLNALVNLEFRVGFQGFPDGGLGVIAGAPGAVGENLVEHNLDLVGQRNRLVVQRFRGNIDIIRPHHGTVLHTH